MCTEILETANYAISSSCPCRQRTVLCVPGQSIPDWGRKMIPPVQIPGGSRTPMCRSAEDGATDNQGEDDITSPTIDNNGGIAEWRTDIKQSSRGIFHGSLVQSNVFYWFGLVHAALRELLSYKISISIRKVEFWTVIKCDCLIFSTIQLF